MVGDVPELVRQRALSNGARGRQWLDLLPGVVAELSDRWGLTIGSTYAGGTAGFVAAVADSAGRECVLKVAMPLDMDERNAFDRSLEAYQLADGRGSALVIDSDPSRAAILMERLGPNLDALDYDVPTILEIIAATLKSFWQPITVPTMLPTGADKAQWLADYITYTWTECGEPCSRRVVDQALRCCDSRAAAFDPATAVLVHGDAHGWNTLADGDTSFKFVDLEGLVSEPAHDLAVAMREYNAPLLAGDTERLVRERAEQLATWCDVDAQAVWEWGFVERVSTSLANLRGFGLEAAAPSLRVAELCT